MQIGKGRPLAVCCWLLSIVAALYVCLDIPLNWLGIGMIIFFVLCVLLVIVSFFTLKRKYLCRYLAFLMGALLIGSSCAFYREYAKIIPAENYATQHTSGTTEITGLVTSEEFYSHYLTCVGVQMDLPDGRTTKLYLNLTGEHDLKIGDRFCAQATIYPVSDAPENERTVRFIKAEGYVLIGYVEGIEHCQTLSRNEFVWRSHLFGRLQMRFSNQLSSAVKGEEGKLCAALLLGTKEELSDTTTLDFRRSGASHLLALSGLHLSLIVLAIDKLLRGLTCPFYLRISLLTLVSIFFLALTGFSISMLRATFMLICLFASRLRGAPHDAVTPLSIFLGITLTIQPTAAYDAGLWLTVLATFALVEVVPALLGRMKASSSKKNRCPGWLSVLWQQLALPLVSTLVILFVLLLPMAIIFGEMSLLSPLSNIILTPLTALVLIFGMLFFPFATLGSIFPILSFIPTIIARILHGFAGTMLSITQSFSDMRGAVLSLRYYFVPWLLLLLVIALLSFLLLKWRHPKRFWFVMAGWCLIFAGCLLWTNYASVGQWQSTYISEKNNELLCLSSNNGVVLFDVTDGSYPVYSEFLANGMPDGQTEIEALVLTHYHNRHISTVYKLLGDIRVRTIWLPMSMREVDPDKAIKDEGNLIAIRRLAEERRVEVRYYLPDEATDIVNGLTLERLFYAMIKRSSHPTIGFELSYERSDHGEQKGTVAFVGASSWESGHADELMRAATSSEVLIFSKHGPILKSSFDWRDWSNIPDIVLFSDVNVSEAIEPSKEMGIVLKRARVILAENVTTITLP